ncbi:O-antigen/teichoic acid export membrane protein [Mycetocola sp. CAN_C7]|uniref:MATE family efflux transporter n=1 Tax=Mycetocola sp. CAN_C7 TaxID=2787724 RepID=UPI0018CA9EC9
MTNDDALPGPRRGLGTQAILLAASTGIAQIITAFLFILAARSADPAVFGQAVAAIALGTSLVGFVDFGTNGLWVRELARGTIDRGDFSSRFASKIVIAAVASGMFTVGAVVLLPEGSYWMAGPVALALLLNQSVQVPLRAMARAELVSFSVLADRICAAAVMALLYLFGADPYAVLWLAICAGSVAAAVMGWILTPKEHRPRVLTRLSINPWRGAGYYGLGSVAVGAQTLDLPILAMSGGSVAAGLYGAVNRWTQPMGLLVSAFASASAPFVARAKTWHEAWGLIKRAIWLPLAALLSCVLVAIFAPQIVELLIGSEYEGSAEVLRFLALGTIPAILNQPLAVFLQSMGHDKPVAFVTMTSVALQLAFVVFFGAMFGAAGAAIGFGVVQLLNLVSLASIAWVTAPRK